MLSLLIFAFYVIQIAASAGWSVVLFRVMEGLSANLIPLGIIMLLFILAAAFGMNHFYPWMHAEGDAIIEGKSWWLNVPGWTIRGVIYIVGFILFRYIIRKKSLEQDNATDYKAHEKGFKYGIIFLAFFMLSESALSWDWIMSLDPHWFSTLFAWYIFASAMVSAVTVIAIVTMYLKAKGYLSFVNDSHLHDLGVYMFGFSIFWTYLWFAQYMLIWYSNMPEETTYFAQRMHDYNFIFYFMVALNFAFPILILMDTEWKRKFSILTIVGLVILVGHYIDVFVMIMPSSVGAQWHFGIPEIGALLFFIGLFIYCGFRAIGKVPLLAKGNPYLKESEDYHN
ncbi:MAG TPA: quinol:cytochrome C oxidoreductase [Saprospiraceae bacterium]|nr:quinol:cytochrome C oxidoreductase [Saprospiraceae bacterium]